MQNKNKYIVAFDLETTGLDKNKDQIIQFSGIKIDKEYFKEIDVLSTYIKPIGNYSISIAAYFKHKITPELLKDKPTLADVGEKIVRFFDDSDILTYNGIHFDIPFLKRSLNNVGLDINFLDKKCYDSLKIEQRISNNKLNTVYKKYTGKTMEENGLLGHDALSDTKAAITIFENQKNKDAEVMVDEDGLFEMMMFQGKIKPCFTFGKYRELPIDFVAKIDNGYLNWLIGFNTLFPSTKKFIQQYMNLKK